MMAKRFTDSCAIAALLLIGLSLTLLHFPPYASGVAAISWLKPVGFIGGVIFAFFSFYGSRVVTELLLKGSGENPQFKVAIVVAFKVTIILLLFGVVAVIEEKEVVSALTGYVSELFCAIVVLALKGPVAAS